MSEASPEKIGWMFIQEYYARLNQDPLHLYQFYTKASTLIHGFEGESSKVACGQAQVQAKVKQQKLFNGCNVLVSSVDCLGSLEGAVVIQVTGEMNNVAGRTVKFAQTFVLAPSKNSKGYYVLNDILRFLGEDEEQEEHDEQDVQPAQEKQYQDFGAIGKPGSEGAPAPAVPAPPGVPGVPSVTGVPVVPVVPNVSKAANVPVPGVSDAKLPKSGSPKPAGEKKERKVFYSAYLKNVTGEIDAGNLRQELEKAGEVTHLQIETDKSRAFVDFIDQESLDRALKMQTISVGPLTVAIEPRKRRKAGR